MAVTPWSWTESNGGASALQTRNAYQAITTGGMTYAFSRAVWNDLIDKIGETADALGRGWISEYLTKYGTKMHFMYAPLSAKMFNSARYNTGYQSWTWSYDSTAKGYVGRDDFFGVADVGDDASDVVYGAYIVELVKRLNTVIDIINGTGASIDLTETIGMFVESAAEIIAASPRGLEAGAEFSISQSGALEQERQRSWILHFRVSVPTHKATLEIGNFTFMEASSWTSMGIVRNIRQSPSSPFAVKFRFPQTIIANNTPLPSEPLAVNYLDGVRWTTEFLQLPSKPIEASWLDNITDNGNMIQLRSIPILGSSRQKLLHSGTVVTQRMGLFASQYIIRNYYTANGRAAKSAGASSAVEMLLATEQTAHAGYGANMEWSNDYVLYILSTAHVPCGIAAAYIGLPPMIIGRTAHIFPSSPLMFKTPLELVIGRTMNTAKSLLTESRLPSNIRHGAEMAQEKVGFFAAAHRITDKNVSRLSTLGGFGFTLDHTENIQSFTSFQAGIETSYTEHFIQPTSYSARLSSENLPTWTLASVNPLTWFTGFSFLEPTPLIISHADAIQSELHGGLITGEHLASGIITVLNTELNGEAKRLKAAKVTRLERLLTKGNAKVGYTSHGENRTDIVITVDTAEMSYAQGVIELFAEAVFSESDNAILTFTIGLNQNPIQTGADLVLFFLFQHKYRRMGV